VDLHVDPTATEGDALSLKPEALLNRVIAAQPDFSSGSQHAMPRQPDGASQHADHLSCGARMTGGAGHRSVSCNFAPRDFADGFNNSDVDGHGNHSIFQYQQADHRRKTALALDLQC